MDCLHTSIAMQMGHWISNRPQNEQNVAANADSRACKHEFCKYESGLDARIASDRTGGSLMKELSSHF